MEVQKMKKIITLTLALSLIFLLASCDWDIVDDLGMDVRAEKPVIYLYPETQTDVTVTLDLDGELTAAYPSYDARWNVTASPDGTLTDKTGREYYCLYWEGDLDTEYDLSHGAVVRGEDTAKYLEVTLAKLGLTEREANEFIIYWLPQMKDSAYNLIAFQSEAYTDAAGLDIAPSPDTLIRVFMAWQELDSPIEIAAQELPTVPERCGFTVVEWGGAKVN